MDDTVIQMEHVSKEYRLGIIGGGTLRGDLESWWARLRGREDPNTLVGYTATSDNKRFVALHDLCLDVQQGDTLGIIGGNGAGKSTLLKLLSRVTSPTSGQIRFRGRIASMLEVGTGFHPELTGRENIYLNGTILGMSKAEVDRKFDEIVAFSEVEQFIDTPVKRYSSGMYVKLAFAVAAHLDSEILIVDEVLAVGDMKFQQKCLGKMSNVASEQRTVLYVSHNMITVQQLCNRAIVLDHGHLVYDGNIDEAIKRYVDYHTVTCLNMDLSDVRRERSSTNAARMLQFEVLKKDDCIFDSHEALCFKLRWRANSDVENLRLLAAITYIDNTLVGAATSAPFTNAQSGQEYETVFHFNPGCLAPGKYQLRLALYQINEFGVRSFLDKLYGHVFSFEIRPSSPDVTDFNWEHRLWGHMKLPEIDIVANQAQHPDTIVSS